MKRMRLVLVSTLMLLTGPVVADEYGGLKRLLLDCQGAGRCKPGTKHHPDHR